MSVPFKSKLTKQGHSYYIRVPSDFVKHNVIPEGRILNVIAEPVKINKLKNHEENPLHDSPVTWRAFSENFTENTAVSL